MDIPPATATGWQEVIVGTSKPNFEFLAAKIFLMRTSMILQRDSSPPTLKTLAQEFRDLFVKNASNPSAQRDIGKIFSQEGRL
jgi:hypothetical protein